jgi:hypothetical protein
MKPTIGRIVHYRHGEETLPAMITRVDGEACSLVVFGCGDTHPVAYFKGVLESAAKDDSHESGTYRWPVIGGEKPKTIGH